MEKICEKCGKRFKKSVFRSLKEWKTTRFCSHSCANSINSLGNKHNLGRVSPKKGKKFPELSGKNNPMWKRVEKVCLECGKKTET